jgi:hypothetical protein
MRKAIADGSSQEINAWCMHMIHRVFIDIHILAVLLYYWLLDDS